MKNFRFLIFAAMLILLGSLTKPPAKKSEEAFGKLRFLTMAFDVEKLKSLVKCGQPNNIKAIFFNCDYDNWSFAKDRVKLLAYTIANDTTTTLIDDDSLFFVWNFKGIKFQNEKKLSNFEINKEEICQILSSIDNAKYLLLQPVDTVTNDVKYQRTIKYKIRYIKRGPVDGKNGKEIFNKHFVDEYAEDTEFYLNPSPPARPNYFNRD